MREQSDYMMAWQGAAFLFDKMYDQSFSTFYYAANSYYSHFNNLTLVTAEDFSKTDITPAE
jgi:hypothetical protein